MCAFHQRAACVAMILAVAGCNSGQGDVPTSQQNIRNLGEAYSQMVREGKPPGTLDELKATLKKRGVDVEKTLKSENDGEDFVILYGVDFKAYTGKQMPVTIYEKTGRGGKRLVFQGGVFHLTEEEFKKAPFPPGKAP